MENKIINGYEIKPGVSLRGADLRGADLTGADLRGANLTEADLTGANLTEAEIDISWKDYVQNKNVIGFNDIIWIGG